MRNPYLPPAASLDDPNAEAAISSRGLVRLFRAAVIATTGIGVFLLIWPWLGLPLSQDTLDVRFADRGGLSPIASEIIFTALQPVWVIAGVGLYFFRWWGRLLLVAAYALATVGNLLGGFAIWMPWEVALIVLCTLLDGTVLTLAFLPPLSRYFAR